VKCPYAILGVERAATTRTIRRAHREKVRQLRAVLCDTGTPEEHERFLDVQWAWEILRDETRRLAHDNSSRPRSSAVALPREIHVSAWGIRFVIERPAHTNDTDRETS